MRRNGEFWRESRTPEAYEADIAESRERVALHKIPVEVVEEARQPADHDLMIVPSLDELLEEIFTIMVAQGRKHLC